VPPGPRQRFLGDILGQSGVADHAERQAVDATLEPADEGGGGATVACAETSQQGLVGWAVGTAGAEIHRYYYVGIALADCGRPVRHPPYAFPPEGLVRPV
jgi:hypothetical protein